VIFGITDEMCYSSIHSCIYLFIHSLVYVQGGPKNGTKLITP